MGFKYKVYQRRLYARKELQDIMSRRIKTCKVLQCYRNKNTQVVYVYERWFTTRIGHSREWVDTTQPVTNSTYSRQVPPREGERFVVRAGGTVDGFVEGSYLCYPAKSSQGDYHGETNGDLFRLWLTTHLLQSLHEPSHWYSTMTSITLNWLRRVDVLPLQSRKMTSWDGCSTITFVSHLVPDAVSCFSYDGRIASSHSIRQQISFVSGPGRVCLPSGHPELNVTEQVWDCMKRHVRSSLRRLTRADVQVR